MRIIPGLTYLRRERSWHLKRLAPVFLSLCFTCAALQNKTAPEHEEDEEDAHLHTANPFVAAASALGQALHRASARLSGVYGHTAAAEGHSQYDASQHEISQYDPSQYSHPSGEDKDSDGGASAGANGLPSGAAIELTEQQKQLQQLQQPGQQKPEGQGHAVVVVSAGGSSSNNAHTGDDAAAAVGADMSFKPVVMAFKDVSYFVPHPDKAHQQGAWAGFPGLLASVVSSPTGLCATAGKQAAQKPAELLPPIHSAMGNLSNNCAIQTSNVCQQARSCSC